MRALWIVPAILVLVTGAQAKPGPAPAFRLTPSPGDYAVATDPLGAMLESDYFRAPSRRMTSGAACRFVFDPFDKQRLASICR
jgi:hypothetical protein